MKGPQFEYNLFKPEILSTKHGLKTALVYIDNYLDWNNPQSPRELYRHLSQGTPFLLEYVLSVAFDQPRFNRFSSTLIDPISFIPKEYLNSFAFEFTDYLGKLFIRLPVLDLPRNFMDLHRDFDSHVQLLQDVAPVAFDNKSEPAVIKVVDDDFFVPRKQSQRARKQAKSRQSITINVNPNLPKSAAESSQIANIVKLNEILEQYLHILRSPSLSGYFTSVYLATEDSSYSSESTSTNVLSNTQQVTIQVSIPKSHPAHPQIQPLKAVKYFSDSADGFGPWALMLSSRAIQHLKTYRRSDQKIWDVLRTKLQQLSQGLFSDDNQKPLAGVSQDIPIYEAKTTKDLRIIYQIDVVPDNETSSEHQVIRVWGIHTHAQIDKRLWSAIAKHQGRLGPEYRSRCRFRVTPKTPGNNIIIPYSWNEPTATLPAETVNLDENMDVEDQLELHSILTLEKFIKMSQSVLNTIIADQDATFPFELTKAEQDIRDHGSSCFVLGRSGTGKTTTMVFKMMNYEMLKAQQTEEDSTNVIPCRQLFVTQSRILAGRVQEYFQKMMISSRTGLKSTADLDRLARTQSRPEEEEEDDLMKLEDEDDDERADLPKKFSELKDHHFPLFLTVDQLCKLLEADCNLSFKRGPRTREHRRAEKTSYEANVDGDMDLEDDDDDGDEEEEDKPELESPVQVQTEIHASLKSSLVTYDNFLYGYWPHFPQNLTKGLEPALVYNEFLGVIKGSEESLQKGHESNWLDRVAYLNLSARRQFTFARQRDRIYDLFERYTKMKTERGDYDAADRTHALLRALRERLSTNQKIDFLYVDEVQDNLIIDARLLRQLCRNPHGIFWAGDTAQTISMGSSFRFDDLKAFIFRLELAQSVGREPVHPESFHLSVNYRSHAGVVNCAHSVIELITRFWPHSIDNLPRERGLVEGPRPVFFAGWNTEDASYEQFFFHESLNIELGAQQCILVRNDQAREELRKQIGDVGLIMTLYEAKGLEFNDVLLYNFFADSTASLAEWRVVLNMVDNLKQKNVPRFDDARHASLCSELKSLYVGITRARSHVWILDSSEKSEPMRVYWESKKLLQLCRPGDPLPKLADKSTPEQWTRQGHSLFKQRLFKHAAQCFTNAGLDLERNIALAYLQRQTAKRLDLQHGKTAATTAAYAKAADEFLVCTDLCIVSTMRTRYLVMAADLFALAGLHVKAAQTYLLAERFTETVFHFKKAKMYEEAAEIMLLHENKVDAKLAEDIKVIAKVYWHRKGELQKASRFFENDEEHLEYLEDFGFEISRASLLKTLERWDDLAHLHVQNGRHLEAIPCWLRQGTGVSRTKAINALFDWLWNNFPLGTTAKISDDSDEDHQGLKNIFSQLQNDLHDLHPAQKKEISMFKAILEHDLKQLRIIARTPEARPPVILLCLDHSLGSPLALENATPEEVAKHLEDYLRYGNLVHFVIGNWQHPEVQRVLGISSDPSSASTYNVSPRSILYKSLKRGEEDTEDPIPVEGDTIRRLIYDVLGRRLQDRLNEEDKVCSRVKVFRPCLNYIINDACNRTQCPNDHVPRTLITVESINLRMRLHLLQLQVVQRLDILHERRNLKWYWLRRFQATVFPPHFALGNPSILAAQHVPEYHSLIQTVRAIIEEELLYLRLFIHSEENSQFITDLVCLLTIAFAFDPKRTGQYTRRAYWMTVQYPPRELMIPYGDRDVYIAHSILEFFDQFTVNSILNGAYFIRHIIQKQLTIDADLLVCFIELVFGAAILASRRSLDGLTLPRSWICDLLQTKGRPLNDAMCSFRMFYTVAAELKYLSTGMYTGQGIDYLRNDRWYSASEAPQIQRTNWVSRIYRCLVLFGYNLHGYRENPRNKNARDKILEILGNFNEPRRIYPHAITRYVKARGWEDAVRAVRSSMEGPIDELIQLCRKDAILANPPRGVRVVAFTAETDIIPALAYVPVVQLNPEAAPFVPKGLQVTQPEMEESVEGEDEEDDSGVVFEEAQVAPEDRSVPITQLELEAANTIHAWYIRQRDRKNQKPEISEFAAPHYSTCCVEVSKVAPSQRYRFMYLGPLPHVLGALHGLGVAISKAKKLYHKSYFKEAFLEQDSQRLTEYSNLRKRQINLWQELKPRSEFHHKGSFVELVDKVREVKNLFEDAAGAGLSLNDLKEDMTIGYKGIAQPPAPPPVRRKRSLPTLNTEDLFE